MEVRWFTFLPAHFACAMRAYVDLDAEARKTPEERAAEAARRRAEEVSDWKRWLSELGDVTWPEGSSLAIDYDAGVLRVRHTRAMLAAIDGVLSEIWPPPSFFELDLRFVKPSPAALEAVGWNDLPRPDVATLWSRLRQRADAPVIAAPRLLLDGGRDTRIVGGQEDRHELRMVSGIAVEASVVCDDEAGVLRLDLRYDAGRGECRDTRTVKSGHVFLCNSTGEVLVFGTVRLVKGERK